jgi:amino acid adenylation domain-containing protein
MPHSDLIQHTDLLHQKVHAQALAVPGAPALAHDGGTVSYGELDQRSEDLAAILTKAGIQPGNIVPVLLPPSELLVIVLLAVLKCGAAYAALDTGWPAERIRRIAGLLSDQLAVVGEHSESNGAVFAERSIVIAEDGSLRIDAAHWPPQIVADDGDAAMVFFTSGSTGEPKAVLAPHRAISRLFDDCTFADFDASVVMAQIAAVPWDAFALELWGPLLTGGTCALVTERPLTPAGLRAAVTADGVNTVFLTTSLFHLIVEEDLTAFTGLATVVVGGEKLSSVHAGRFLDRWPDVRLVNGYGPVESAVFALTHDVRPGDVTGEIPLGLPVRRTQVLIMGGQLDEQCGPDEIGEICIAGDGLAIGYIGDPGLTAEKFRPAVIDGRELRLYRTGDLGRRAADGVVHFNGRPDRQVKVRGHRLELAGLERTADELSGVRRSLVIARSDDDTGNVTSLRMFYLGTAGHPAEPELMAELRRLLPAYSVPDQVIAVDEFPLLPNGKLDTRTLIALADQGRANGARRDPSACLPADTGRGAASIEEIVAAEVGELLELAEVDRLAPLFAIGATSLTAVRLCSRLGARFGRAIPVSALLHDPTVAGLTTWLTDRKISGDTLGAPSSSAPAKANLSGCWRLTPMQQSFVLEHLRSSGDPANHCLLTWKITGPLEPDRLAAAVRDVHSRHGYLRLKTVVDDDILAVDSTESVQFAQLPAPDSIAAALLLEQRLRLPFDLTSGLVWRAVLVHDLQTGHWLFGVAVHHVAFDGWSEHLLARELGLAYATPSQGEAGRLSPAVPTPPETYRMFEELAAAADLTAQRDYWAGTLAGLPDITWPALTEPDGEDGRCLIEHSLSDDLLSAASRAARQQGVTLLTILLAGVYEAVSAQIGQQDFGVGVPISTRGTEALQQPIGCLVDTVCVRLRPADGNPAAVGPAVAGAMANADLPFAQVVQLLRPPRTGRHPLYQVMVALQDSPAPELELPECQTEVRPRNDVPWRNAELVIELFTAAGTPTRLRASCSSAVMRCRTFTVLVEQVIAHLRAAAQSADR